MVLAGAGQVGVVGSVVEDAGCRVQEGRGTGSGGALVAGALRGFEDGGKGKQ